MGKVDGPRHGSMQYWPRKRARKETPRVNAKIISSELPVNGFSGYKVGMTHVAVKDAGANALAKNLVVTKPVTVLECPPLKVAGIRFYKLTDGCLTPSSDIFADKLDKELGRKIIVPKSKEIKDQEFDELRLIVYTQPKLTSLAKKKPELFELDVGGSKEEQLALAKERLGKEIAISEVFKVNDLVDIHGVTSGKGFQGSVKRFGVGLRHHNSEKTKRGPGSLGPWCGQQHFMYRVAHAGQTGYHLRTENNKSIIFIGDDPNKINPKGGFVRYGNVKSTYILLMGSIPGNRKRMLRITPALRPNKKKKTDSIQLLRTSLISKQRR